MMFIIDLKNNKNLVDNYHQHYQMIEQEQTGQRPWLDAGFYHRQNTWLQENFHCMYLTNKNQLVFKSKKHYTMFLLRWS